MNSNIWSLNINHNGTNNNDDRKSDSNTDTQDTVVTNTNANLSTPKVDKLLYDLVESKTLLSQLYDQKKYIYESILSEIKIHNDSWTELMDFKIDNNRKQFITQEYIKADYESNELPFDNVNNFNGKLEYDNNGYLTKLLIATHQIDPIFQNTLKNTFSNDDFGIECTFSSAPPKTKARCEVKALLDYSKENGRQWPYTSNIIDLVRCSIVFNNSKDMLIGINKFVNLVKDNQVQYIKHILRCKNGFKDFKNIKMGKNGNNNNNGLSNIDYRDIKFNVLIEYNGIKLIGEIQFLLSLMLIGKKKGHSVYSFVRNKTHYYSSHKIVNSNNNNDDYIIQLLFQYILLKNLSKFYNLLLNLNHFNKKYVLNSENQNRILKFLKENDWKKGEKIFVYFSKLHETNQNE